MKKIVVNETEYELLENYKDGFDYDTFFEKSHDTDYFDTYDYIVGDWSYGKLRLKGFCNKDNPNYKAINGYENVKDYLKKYCAYECQYFILKKIIH